MIDQRPVGEGEAEFQIIPVTDLRQGENGLRRPIPLLCQAGCALEFVGAAVTQCPVPLTTCVDGPVQNFQFSRPLHAGLTGNAIHYVIGDINGCMSHGEAGTQTVGRHETIVAAVLRQCFEQLVAFLLLAKL